MIALLLTVLFGASADSSRSLWTVTETGIAAGTMAATGLLFTVDRDVKDWSQSHKNGATELWSTGAKSVGDGYWTLPLAGGLWWAGSNGRAPRLARASRNGLEAWSMTELIVQIGKYGVQRHRPRYSKSPYVFDGPGIDQDNVSFPSGHSASAWGLLPAYALEYSDHPWLAGGLYAVALSTSLSRVHDNWHWSSDVAFSAGLGLVCNRVVRSWNQRRDSSWTMVPSWNGSPGLMMVRNF
ncbi:MAG: phosphatase PAP2 family protein [Fibrobacterota bacterium]|nr:phosphatase PAP2 family protein [Fibrobacterota bacterium]QQS03686.1 MAG: phosphatase PAP2 family protein [Fibrobacterota bacterium]